MSNSIDVHLTNKQQLALHFLEDKETTEILFGGAAGGGKTYFGCLWLIQNCIRYPKTRWLMGRAKLESLKKTTLKTFFDICEEWGLKQPEHYIYNAQEKTIRFFNGSEILLKDLFAYPSDPHFTSLGSLEITGAFIDEVADISLKAKNMVASRMRYRLDEFNLIPKLLMTCNPSKNWSYEEFYKKDKTNDIESYKKFIQSLVTDNPFISSTYIEQLKKMDQQSIKRLLYGEWEYDESEDSLIEYDAMLDLFTNYQIMDSQIDKNYYISADIARLGKDKTVIILWQGNIIIDIIQLSKVTTDITIDKIKELKNTYSIPNSRIIIDAGGVGGGVVDQLNGCKSFIANAKPLMINGKTENYDNLKSQLFFKLADFINKREIYIKNNEFKTLIIQELEQIRMKELDSERKLGVISKDLVKTFIGRSPDYADAISFKMFFEINKITKSFQSLYGFDTF